MPWRGDAFPSLPLRDVSPLHKAQAFCVRGAVAPSEEGAGSAPEAASAGLRSCVSSCARIFRRPLASYELCGSAPLAPGYPPNPCRCRARRGEAPLPGPSFLSPAIPRLPFLRPYSSFCVFLLCRPCVPLCGAGRREKGEGRPPGRAVGERAGAEVSFFRRAGMRDVPGLLAGKAA